VPGEREPHAQDVEARGDGEESEDPVGALMSAATLGRKNASRITRAAPSTASPAQVAASSACDSQDGPSRNVPVEMIPVAMTNAK
jgi:hypothetical protein